MTWDWFIVSQSASITMQDICNHLDFPWDFRGISYNPNMNIEMFNKFPNENWLLSKLSFNIGITVQDIIDHPTVFWNWTLCKSSKVNIQLIEKISKIIN